MTTKPVIDGTIDVPPGMSVADFNGHACLGFFTPSNVCPAFHSPILPAISFRGAKHDDLVKKYDSITCGGKV